MHTQLMHAEGSTQARHAHCTGHPLNKEAVKRRIGDNDQEILQTREANSERQGKAR